MRLSGPRIYDDHIADEPWGNVGCAAPLPCDLCRNLALCRRPLPACIALIGAVAASIGRLRPPGTDSSVSLSGVSPARIARG